MQISDFIISLPFMLHCQYHDPLWHSLGYAPILFYKGHHQWSNSGLIFHLVTLHLYTVFPLITDVVMLMPHNFAQSRFSIPASSIRDVISQSWQSQLLCNTTPSPLLHTVAGLGSHPTQNVPLVWWPLLVCSSNTVCKLPLCSYKATSFKLGMCKMKYICLLYDCKPCWIGKAIVHSFPHLSDFERKLWQCHDHRYLAKLLVYCLENMVLPAGALLHFLWFLKLHHP